MSLEREISTVPAHPLGIPVDGRERYGMTPEQAHVYRWLVKHRPHNGPFRVNFAEIGRVMVCSRWNVFSRVEALVERGWIKPRDAHGTYEFVQPVKLFREVCRE